MTDLTVNEEKALNRYFMNLRKCWMPFSLCAPYQHWLIEVTDNPANIEAVSIVRPIANNNGHDERWTHWRPITMSTEGIHQMTEDERELDVLEDF